MTAMLLFVIVVLTIAIFALALVWFVRDSKEREKHRRPAYGKRNVIERNVIAEYSWDGGTRTSPRQWH